MASSALPAGRGAKSTQIPKQTTGVGASSSQQRQVQAGLFRPPQASTGIRNGEKSPPKQTMDYRAAVSPAKPWGMRIPPKPNEPHQFSTEAQFQDALEDIRYTNNALYGGSGEKYYIGHTQGIAGRRHDWGSSSLGYTNQRTMEMEGELFEDQMDTGQVNQAHSNDGQDNQMEDQDNDDHEAEGDQPLPAILEQNEDLVEEDEQGGNEQDNSYLERHQAWIDVLDENLATTRKNPASKEVSNDFEMDMSELLTAVDDITETSSHEGDVPSNTLYLNTKLFAEGITQLQRHSLIIHTVDLRVTMSYFERWAEVTIHQLLGVKIVSMCQLDPFCFHVVVDSGKAKAHIFANSPLKMGNKMVFPLPWDTRFSTKDLKSRACPVWLELYDVHPGLMKFDINMLRSIGPIIYAAKNTETQRINIVRGCVLQDLNRPLPEYIPIVVPEAPNKIMKQRIRYLRLPDGCFNCRQRGHFARACPLEEEYRQNQKTVTEERRIRQENRTPGGAATGRTPGAESRDEDNSARAQGTTMEDFKVVTRRRTKPKFQTPDINKSMKVDNRYGVLESSEELQDDPQEADGNIEIRSRRVETTVRSGANSGPGGSSSSKEGASGSGSSENGYNMLIREVIDLTKQKDPKSSKGDTTRIYLCSWNINGTAGDLRGRTIRNRIWNSYKEVDIFAFQELKSKEYELENTLRLLTDSGTVVVDYHSNGWGNAALVLKPTIRVLDYGVKGDGQVVWARFHTAKGMAGIMSVYAPHDLQERIRLWEWIRNKVADEDWVLGGDLNMVEWGVDTNCKSPILSSEEAIVWMDLKLDAGLVDCYEAALRRDGPRFTRVQIKGNSVEMSRLDCFYLTNQGRGVQQIARVLHDAKAGVSDHCPVVLELKVTEESQHRSSWKTYLKISVEEIREAEVRTRVVAAWRNNPTNCTDP
ncbi:hypothetical protein R1sor_021319 [Riccia sorocarpa]|uniref:CCHC-type domain-containing protein n=1 Tax=Riccia sorocarpa TaxID=122646 RepID=A0ABD3GGS5_9MARC